MSARPRLTPHQKMHFDILWRMGARGGSLNRRDGWPWIYRERIGGYKVWFHLRDKGYVDIENRPGPRGGERLYVRVREI